MDQLFGEVERRVDEEETNSQASVEEIQKVEAFLHQLIAEGKGKEASVDNEILKMETSLDEDQIKGKKFQQDLEDKGQKIHKIEEFLDANQVQERVYRKELEETIEKLMAVNHT